MSELHRFLFDAMPVRGALVRLDAGWQELLRRRAAIGSHQAYPDTVRDLLGEMTAAGVLLHANIKFDGALVLQIMGEGPVRLAVTEVGPQLDFRTMANVDAALPEAATWADIVGARAGARCAITLDPRNRQPGSQAYQGVVSLLDRHGQPLQRMSDVLEGYMQQSEQLDSTLVLAADGTVAAGLLLQRLPGEGDQAHEDYQRLSLLARSLQRDELLQLDGDTILRRLFWEEPITRFVARLGDEAPAFACTCSRERVARMVQGLGQAEVHDLLQERGAVEVGCEFCGAQYRFDAIDAAHLFVPGARSMAASGAQH